jgi:prepilin-type N-terminal cleavage/methylation domain-containing protein/prepilin-type processing-associated H-X9-DG protein
MAQNHVTPVDYSSQLRSRNPHSRKGSPAPLSPGFTLIELLVVIAIIGTLVSLLLPAVQQARESGRRITCVSNVKQLGIALQNYESTNHRLPAAGTFDDISTATYSANYWRIELRSGTNYSWVTKLLPYMEEQALHDQFDFTKHVSKNPANPQVQQPPTMICPSDDSRGRFYEKPDPITGEITRYGKANYAAFCNVYHIDSIFYPAAISLYGQPLSHVTDGLSSTLAFAEIRTREHPQDQRGAWALPWSGSTLLSFDLHPTQYPTNNADKTVNDYAPWPGSLGYTQYPNSLNGDVLYQCPDPAGEQLDAMPCNTQIWGYISSAPRSLHPGGVNVVFLDGHVGFLPNNIDEYAMLYMVDPADGQTISEQH